LLKSVKNSTFAYSIDIAKGYNYSCFNQDSLFTDYIVYVLKRQVY